MPGISGHGIGRIGLALTEEWDFVCLGMKLFIPIIFTISSELCAVVTCLGIILPW